MEKGHCTACWYSRTQTCSGLCWICCLPLNAAETRRTKKKHNCCKNGLKRLSSEHRRRSKWISKISQKNWVGENHHHVTANPSIQGLYLDYQRGQPGRLT